MVVKRRGRTTTAATAATGEPEGEPTSSEPSSGRGPPATVIERRKPSEEEISKWRARALAPGELWLAPLTKGGNLPFRRLVADDFGARVTVSEMAFAKFLCKGNRVERARIRRRDDGGVFGAQIATKTIDEGVRAGLIIAESNADFIDLNCGCPIHETWHRGLGAALLKKPAKLERLVEGIAEGVPLPLTVKIRLGIDSSNPARRIAEGLENAGASAIVIHGRTKEQRYTSHADFDTIREIVQERNIPIIGNGDVLTWYDARDRMEYSGVAAMMVGRGALIKPWIFKEFREQKAWEPTAEERVGVYYKLRGYMREQFGDDDLGKRRFDDFFPWHLGFFCRYRPLPEEIFGGRAISDPLLQSRLGFAVQGESAEDLPLLEQLLRCEHEEAHVAIANALWSAETLEEAIYELEILAKESLAGWQAAVASGDRRSNNTDTIRG
jgi:tRNA-dihydrouridine synthase 3